MRKHGATCFYIDARDRELLAAYRDAMRRATFIRPMELLRQAVNSPTSRFWVSPKRASVVLSEMFRGRNPLSTMHPTRQEMFREIFARAQRLRAKYPTMDIPTIANKVVYSHAPKFYITAASAKTILHLYKHRKH